MTTKPPCKLDHCQDSVVARGYCNRHYKKLRAYGDPLAIPDRPRLAGATCSRPNCDRPVHAKTLCSNHYHVELYARTRKAKPEERYPYRNVAEMPARPDFRGWSRNDLLRLVAQQTRQTWAVTRAKYPGKHALVQQAVALWHVKNTHPAIRGAA